MKVAILNWLFLKLFGEIDVSARIYTNETHIMIAELSVQTRLGSFTFPVFQKEIPLALTGYEIEAERDEPAA